MGEIVGLYQKFGEEVEIKDDYDVLSATLAIGRMHDQKTRMEPYEVPKFMENLRNVLKVSGEE